MADALRIADQLVDVALAAPPLLGSVRLVTVDGPTGSGKTTLAIAMRSAVAARGRAVVIVPTDHFATWDNQFGWWPDLEACVLRPFAAGRPASYVAVDWSSGSPVFNRPITVPVPEVLLVEGVSASRRDVAGRTSMCIWVEACNAAERLERVIARDGEHERPFVVAWQLAEQAWFEADQTAARADVRFVDGVLCR